MSAAAMIVTPSGEPIVWCSEMMRAEMPTLVAGQRMRGTRALGSMKGQPRTKRPTTALQMKEQTMPPMPTMVPATEYLKNVRTSVSSPDWKRRAMEPSVATE